MPICKVCSQEANENDVYCTNCGHKLIQDPLPKETEVIRTPCSRKIALFLAFFLGAFGFHDWYLGRKTNFFIKFGVSLISYGILSPIMWIWSIVDGINILRNKHYKDAHGIELIK